AYLILEKPANGSVSPQGVSAAEITERLRTGRHLPQLIFLAACRSAQQSTTDAFRGLGPRLVVAGCPAVVAMQERVEVGVARQFGRQFYSQLLEHGTVDLAVNRARRAVMDDWAWQWAVPVLFMRLPNGLLFRPADRFPPEERRPYKGLAPYTPLDRDLFQGRSSESEDVYRRIREHAVVVVYGEAGVGLTSLMEAGVRPRLELDGDLVVTVSEYAGLAGEVRSQMGVPLRVPGDAPLPDVLRAAAAEPFDHLVLVLDQFERAFDLPAETQDSIVAELAGSREALGDTLRLVFVVREDRLARLSALQARLEGLMQATVRIPPLLTDEAERAIVEPLRVLNWPVTIIPQTLAARRIVPDLAELSDGTGMVDPGDLQIVCDWLYRKALEPEAAHAITEDLYDREKSADGIMARYMEQTLETRLADRRPLAEHVLATMASPGVGRWVQPEQLPANGASSEQLIGVLERLAETQMLVERAMNGQRRYALANQTVAEQARRLGGREVERQYQAEAELERVWSAWLARDVPATRGQLRYLAEAGGHLTPPPVRTLLLLRSAVARDTPAAPWLDRLRSDAGRALIRELEEPNAPIPKNLRSSRSTLNKAGLLLGLHDAGRGEAGRSDGATAGATADRHTLRPFGSSLRTRPASPLRSGQPGDERPPFGPVAWSAVSHSDAVTRQTAALALLAMDRHRGLDRLDWALRAVEARGLRRRRRAELHGALADADPEIEKLNTDLPALDRAGIWWWRARRRIIRDRHRLAGLTVGGGIGAGLGLALLRGITAALTRQTVGLQMSVEFYLGALLGGAVTLGMALAEHLLLKQHEETGDAPPIWHVPFHPDRLPAVLAVALGTLFFGLAHLFVIFSTGSLSLSGKSLPIEMGFVAGLGLGLGLYGLPLRGAGRRPGIGRWLLSLGAAALIFVLVHRVFIALDYIDRSIPIIWDGGFYRAELTRYGNLVWWQRFMDRYPQQWFNFVAQLDAALVGIVLTLGTALGLQKAAEWLAKWQSLVERAGE
ncbi:MAG: CHAT domain-containing protein, partial [Anaerolineae bacterium]